MLRTVSLPIAVTLAGTALAGCAGSGAGGDVEAVASAFSEAIRDGDGGGACARLVPKAQSSVESGGSSCAQQILELGLTGGAVRDPEVWGQWARVHIGGDTAFLTQWAQTWRIAAAGCRPRRERPYDCELEA
ncbi:hypothetical protein [Actinomadura sp. KC216]|uniref:hypothetical protein n=1 Tax=Actinomadura sp. KC216 TaxID=2530370 RepID=UPI00140441C0|nr:hypothetical protein [Actinomadura sp. KC216]